MSRIRILSSILFFVLVLLIGSSCSHAGKQLSTSGSESTELINQQADGTISLKLEDAEYYNDKDNPSSNTAEWRFAVAKAGRYEIWLSSATRDTLDLKYINSIKLSIRDERLNVEKGGEKVVLNNNDLKYPYRADSYIGSYYIHEPGEYTIQLISEKAVLSDAGKSVPQQLENTKLMSVMLVPMKQ
jgi:hypothetical protein